MSSIKGDFMDSINIVIIDDVPHFSYSGKSYLEKLKNGLSLDLVFFMEDSVVQPKEKVQKNVKVLVEEDYKQPQPFKHELFVEEYDYEVMPMPRKGKKIIKNRSDKNMKKNKVKQNGYNHKMHTIEDNLPETIQLTDPCNDHYSEYFNYFDYFDYFDSDNDTIN
jgi:hypothetical protein